MTAAVCLLLVPMPPARGVAEQSATDSTSPEGMVLIPGGSFEMGIDAEDLEELVEMGRKVPHMSLGHARAWFGDEIPRHTVAVESFYMDTYEVTNREFRRFVEETGYEAEGDWQDHARNDRLDHPVVNVSWHDAQAYAEWCGKRLPSEEEWEYAAIGGRDVKWFPWGDTPDPSRANYRHQGESFLAGLGRLLGGRKMNTMPVGSFEPNGFGLYDMCGNVSEWVASSYGPYPGAALDNGSDAGRDGRAGRQMQGDEKVRRDGNWDSPNAVFIRLKERRGEEPDSSGRETGFRCAKSTG
jgi:formylglycine-generating enzyme required for sulfatase activity